MEKNKEKTCCGEPMRITRFAILVDDGNHKQPMFYCVKCGRTVPAGPAPAKQSINSNVDTELL